MDTNDTIQFLKEREERLGGRIRYRTYCTWYARLGCEKREYGVFLCLLGDGSLYLEDFDRQPQILGITLKSRKREKYVKLSRRIPLEAVRSVSRVRKSHALSAVNSGSSLPSNPAGWFARALFPIVTQLVLEDGGCHYFELISPSEFEREIERARRMS